MSPPIRDGSGNSIGAIRLGDGSEISEVRTGAGDVLFSGDVIPDSVVSRTADDSSAGVSKTSGLRIESDVEWPDIGAEISSNTSGLTRAYIYRQSDGQLIGETDISGLSAGDTFRFSDVNLDAADGTDATKYNIVADAEGSSYTQGFKDSASYPFESADGNLRLINGADDADGTNNNPGAPNIVRVGNVGFS